MFQRALICTELTDGLQILAKHVSSLAAGGLKQIVFLHVLPIPTDQIPREDDKNLEQVRDRLSKALSNAPAGVEVKIEVKWGSKPTEAILATSKHYHSELILLGSPSRSLLNEKLFGSTTVGLCQKTTTALMILRPQLISTYTSEELDLRCRHLFRHLLLPYDGSESAKYLLQQLKQHIQQNPGYLERCLLCYVAGEARDPILKQHELQQGQEILQAAKLELEAVGVQVDIELRQGSPALQILTAAAEHDISAIATSSRTIGTLLEMSVPSITGEILRRSWYPILYFPPEKR